MEQLKAFLEKAGADSELTIKLEELGEGTENSDEFIAIAAEYGFIVTTNDINEVKSELKKTEISEDQLESVAGGSGWSVNRYCREWCKNRTTMRLACQNPFLWCDHLRYDYLKEEGSFRYFRCECVMKAFPTYINEEVKPER